MLGEREAADVERFTQHVSDAMHLRLAAVGKATLANHLSRDHGVQGKTPLPKWTKDELENEHESVHRTMRR